MAARADGKARRHGVLHLEEPDQEGRENASHDPGQDDRRHRDGGNAPMAFRDAHRDGGSHGFGKQRIRHRLVQPEQAAEKEHASHGGERTRRAARQDRQPVLLQKLHPRINRYRQAAGGGGEKHVDDAPALIVALIRDLKQQKHARYQNDGDDQGIADHKPRLFLNPNADGKRHNAESDSEKRRAEQLRQ